MLIPFELGYLFYQGKRINDKLTLKGVIMYSDKMPLGHFILLVVILLVWSFLILGAFSSKVDSYLVDKFFYWLPEYFFFTEDLVKNINQYSKPVLLITWLTGLIFSGLIGPLVEELYFRGYILPRQSHMKGWAPLINVILFSLYHFFTPWQNLSRIIALLPLVYVVWWKTNIHISIVTHCLLNIIGILGMLPLILRP